MERLAAWLKREMKLDHVSYRKNHSHGHLLCGNKQGKELDLLVVSSGHVWIKPPSARAWSTTGIYVPDRVLY